MHASKGLEFPIVINVLKASDRFKEESYKIVQLEPGEKSIYWEPDVPLPEPDSNEVDAAGDNVETVKGRFKLERYQEMSRLYYVAFTRASLFQYVPVFLNNTKKTPTHEWPFDVFAKAANDNFVPGVEVREEGKYKDKAREEEKVTIPDLTEKRSKILSANRKTRKMPFQTSYSNLAHSQESPKAAKGSDKGADDEHTSLLGYTPEIRREIASKTKLTPGSKTGDLLHNLFELSDWSEVMSHTVEELRGDYGEEISDIIVDVENGGAEIAAADSASTSPDSIATLSYTLLLAQELKKAGLWTSDQALLKARCLETTHIIKNTLECVIKEPETDYDLASMGLTTTFRLGDLPKSDILPEMEFQFSFGEDAELFEENAKGGGWIKGFMDLVFRRPTSDGFFRYYVLDWKSNALQNYTQDEIQSSMLDSHYDVQARLYQLAMHEWLKEAYGGDYIAKKFLGGAIYAYVRGNHDAPSSKSFKNYPLDLAEVAQSRKSFIAQIKEHKKFNSGVQ
jgi:ATP-dependent exoDNAse (exonuclease V) beta subunit